MRALLALEKTTQNLKGDRLAAERAQKQRHEAKHAFRRRYLFIYLFIKYINNVIINLYSIYKDSLDQIISEENLALRKKHNLPLKNQAKEFSIT